MSFKPSCQTNFNQIAILKLISLKRKNNLLAWLCQIDKNLYFDYFTAFSNIINVENIQKVNSKIFPEDNIVKKMNYTTFQN
ncbi:hypothetical protein CDLVIII_2490 [Clostridium sp. DL-VIII]|nr:hypothetical protein CDLVIII_2490 [Clostridium sp. DL-VIII]